MSDFDGSGSPRVTQAHRDRAVELLGQAYADGRIGKDEMDERVAKALAADSASELGGSIRGVPPRAATATGSGGSGGSGGGSGGGPTPPAGSASSGPGLSPQLAAILGSGGGSAPAGTATAARAGIALPDGGERVAAWMTHWSGYLTSFFGPAIVMASARTRYVREQAVEALNFQLTALGAVIAVGFVAGVAFGFLHVLMPLMFVVWAILTGIGGLAALAGNGFRYPWVLRLVHA